MKSWIRIAVASVLLLGANGVFAQVVNTDDNTNAGTTIGNTASVSYEVEHILFISPEVALTGVRQQYVDRDGGPTSAGLPSYVWRRSGDTWKMVAGQNTTLPAS